MKVQIGVPLLFLLNTHSALLSKYDFHTMLNSLLYLLYLTSFGKSLRNHAGTGKGPSILLVINLMESMSPAPHINFEDFGASILP